MAVIGAVLACGAAAGLLAGLVAWLLPNFDPAGPHASAKVIVEEVELHPRLSGHLRSRFDPARLTGLALTVALAILLGGTVASGALLEMVRHNAGLARYDLAAARWGGAHATNGSTQFLRDVSLLGGSYVMIAVALL